MAAAHVLLHWNNNLGYFSTLYLRLFLNQVVLIWIAHIRMTQLVVGTRVKYSVYGGKKRGEYYGQQYYFLYCHLHQISFLRCSFSSDRLHCILRWEEQVVTCRISPPALGWCWLHLATRVCCPVPSSGPPTRGINDASPQSCSCTTFKYPHHQLHLCSTVACSVQPAATCCKLLMQIFDKCIWSILLWVGTSRQAATFSFNYCQAFILYLSQSSMYAILCKQWAIECWVRAK